MSELKYLIMCFAHRTAKAILGRSVMNSGFSFADIHKDDLDDFGKVAFQGLSDPTPQANLSLITANALYPVENAVATGTNSHLMTSFRRKGPKKLTLGAYSDAPNLWREFIEFSSIPDGYRNAGFKYAGYIASGRNSWCLPSWIWTSAATTKYYCSIGKIDDAEVIAEKFLSLQDPNGGWVVRSDYSSKGEIPVVAPNDSAYIANNAMLELYKRTSKDIYLESAIRCANWIMKTSRPDGLVWTGYDKNTGVWLKAHTIVDIGFTAGLFAELYNLTNDVLYLEYLEKFVKSYIRLFYIEEKKGFTTSIDSNDLPIGGRFARGQAWALEGLIPAYKILKDDALRLVIENCIETLKNKQLRNGGWSYNFDKSYLGEDCKGVPVIAMALLDWWEVQKDPSLLHSAKRAIKWCSDRTSLDGPSKGGIFSYNAEGAIVHNLYSETALVYSSAYALQVSERLSQYATNHSN